MDTIEEMANKAYPKDKLTAVETVNRAKRKGYIKACEEYESLPKIHGWVARNLDNTLLFHSEKPTYKAPSGCWVVRSCEALRNILWLNKNDFPEITSESEPVEVELLIRKV